MRKEIPVALDSGHTSDYAKFYLNQESGLIGESGSIQPYTSGQDGRVVAILPFKSFLKEKNNYIYARICSVPGKPFFWRGPEVNIGQAQSLLRTFSIELSVAFLLASVYVSVGLYHLLLAIRRPADIFNLYFGLFSLFFSFFHLTNNASAEVIFEKHKELQSIVDQVSLMVFIGNLLLFIDRLFLRHHSKFAVIFSSAYFAIAAADIFVNHELRSIFLESVEISMILVLPYILFLTIRESLKGNTDARLLLVGVALILAGGLHDLAVEQRWIRSIFIMPYTFLAFIVGIALILANRFVRVHNEVEELNTDLEEKVRKRTADLQRSLSEIRDLKHQQDGDYFLTSQLMQPLAGNYAKSEIVNVEILCRQKKRFQFRNWQGELGGDLCAAYSLQLRGRPVLVFFNGDAMGKSMQGAGGALIMGTVFKTIVTRTQNSSEMQNRFPEQWLHQCYQELKHVFVAFDGRMLISMVLGLVDEESGLMYFVNAEHPRIVLFRDGLSEFIAEAGMLRKVGVEDPEEIFVVQIIQMHPNDVIIIGSDGRDDVQLGHTSEGNSIINEDEKAILKDVSVAQGELLEIEKLIRERGQVIDDLSLIRIAYKEELPNVSTLIEDTPKNIESELIGNRRRERRALKKGLQTKDFVWVAAAGQRYLEHYPDDSPVYLWVSYALSRLGDYEKAINFGECLLMRDPQHSTNIEHLVRLHRKQGNLERVDSLLSARTKS
ncbi:SpoIIE family protein phosphatase [Leptospira perolatii]|nr:SpoIIE family protein phosphatase [Leptospira perolatii]